MVDTIRWLAGVAWGMRRAALVAALIWATGWQPGPYAIVQVAADLLFVWIVFALAARWRPAGLVLVMPGPDTADGTRPGVFR